MHNEKIILLLVAITITCFYLLPLDEIQDYLIDLLINDLILNNMKPIGVLIFDKISSNVITIMKLVGIFLILSLVIYYI